MPKPLSITAIRELGLTEIPEAIGRRALPLVVDLVTARARREAPSRRTSPKSLVAKIAGKVLPDGTSGVVQATARHAHLVHDGTAPHDTQARRKQALRYVSGGIWKFRKSAPHPGARANPFLDRARDESVADAERVLLAAAERELAEVTR